MNNRAGKVRIIGGQFRGRHIHFPAIDGLRPTPDRVRETLFNWLAPIIHNAHCLDLFAGSGALGFEALSRGAAHVTFIDQSSQIITHLKKYADIFDAKKIEIIKGEVPDISITHTFDIVFLDPPFHQNLITPVSHWLTQMNCLNENAYIYIETEIELNLELPTNWQMLKNKKAGQVAYYLYTVK